MTEIRAVLFDAAGTLIESVDSVGSVYAEVAKDYGVDLPVWRIDDAFGRIFRSADPMAFPEAAPEEVPALERKWWRSIVRSTFLATDGMAKFSDFEAYFEELFQRFAAPESWQLRSGAREALERLQQQGLALAVVSNFDGRLRGLLDGLDLSRYFAQVVLPGDVGATKPDPAIFQRALEGLGVGADSAVYVGDHPEKDLVGARSFGMRAIDVAELATLSNLPERIARLG